MPRRDLHTRANGLWGYRMAEWNKWLFFRAYVNRIDKVAERRALSEAKSFLEQCAPMREKVVESSLLKQWKASPPQDEHEWKRWIAIHQRHLFVPTSLKGGFYRNFPAWRKSDLKADVELTQLFYQRLLERQP